MSEDSRKKLFSGALVDAGMQKDLELFNSLLARGKSNNVRDRNKSLFLTGLSAVFQGKQRKLQQKEAPEKKPPPRKNREFFN